jgi:hypothetical protein
MRENIIMRKYIKYSVLALLFFSCKKYTTYDYFFNNNSDSTIYLHPGKLSEKNDTLTVNPKSSVRIMYYHTGDYGLDDTISTVNTYRYDSVFLKSKGYYINKRFNVYKDWVLENDPKEYDFSFTITNDNIKKE